MSSNDFVFSLDCSCNRCNTVGDYSSSICDVCVKGCELKCILCEELQTSGLCDYNYPVYKHCGRCCFCKTTCLIQCHYPKNPQVCETCGWCVICYRETGIWDFPDEKPNDLDTCLCWVIGENDKGGNWKVPNQFEILSKKLRKTRT